VTGKVNDHLMAIVSGIFVPKTIKIWIGFQVTVKNVGDVF